MKPNNLSKYSCKYIAYKLVRKGGKGLDRLSQSLFNSNVDLNPHQVEAALFAIRSPFTKGVLLADEVGLGKTIEAGLVISQFWAESKKKIIVICPASLRKQWQIELEDKFNIPCQIIDGRTYKKFQRNGAINPFDFKEVIITSIHYSARKAIDLRAVKWDLVVIDEAHKLRNSHRQSNKIGQKLRWATEDKRKILLTATPLQNSLTELFGIIGVIDEKLFGDLPTFRTLYANSDGDLNDLKSRISSICKRSLRKDVLDFVKYTERKLITIDFIATDEEYKLYKAVSSFLQREETYSFPKRQKHLIIMIVRKVMASSTFALSRTLETIKKRLVDMNKNIPEKKDILTSLLESTEIDDEILEDILSENSENSTIDEPTQEIDKKKLEEEIKEVERLILWSKSLSIDSKTKHLTEALNIGYEQMELLGAEKKAVIFTESRRTMEFLRDYLDNNGYKGKVITFSGSNKDPRIKEVYAKWLIDNSETGRITGSRAVDIRHAIIENFKAESEILIATEAGAEGINLQFCSLLINFDLPWNPQRIEQRIGRIHRYGQKFDIVVINFLNKRNAADMRVYDLLQHKFNLFEGIFGSSDEVLGQLESSAGLEARITAIYQNCRTEDEINKQFNNLQRELEEQIQNKLSKTKEQLFIHFDEDVHKKIKIDYDEAIQALDNIGKDFWDLSKSVLENQAEFNDDLLQFVFKNKYLNKIPSGNYYLSNNRKAEEDSGFRYTMNHPLGEYCIKTAKKYDLQPAEVEFSISDYDAKISVLEKMKNKTGWLILQMLSIESIENEEYLLFSGFDENGEYTDPEIFKKMFRLNSNKIKMIDVPPETEKKLIDNGKIFAQSTARQALEQNNILFLERREQLYRWAEDVIISAEKTLQQIKAELRAKEHEAGFATTIEQQREAQQKITELEKKKRASRRNIWEIEDNIADKRNLLIKELEKKMTQNIKTETLFMIKWRIV